MTIPYDELPTDRDHRTHMSFIKSEMAARAGVGITGASTGLTFVQSIDPYLKFGIALVGLFVGLATFTYYALAIAEKWRKLRRDEE